MSKNPFENLTNRETKDYHLFTSSHPYMRSVGLDVFTTGTLFSWWAQSSSVNNTSNKSLVKPSTWSNLLSVNRDTNFKWFGWKPDLEVDNFGVYEEQGLSGFSGHDGGESWFYNSKKLSRTYDLSDLQPIIDSTKDGNNLLIINGGTTPDDESLSFVPISRSLQLDLFNDSFGGVGQLIDLINLNAYMVHFENLFPHFSWDLTDPDGASVGGVPLKSLIAARELLLEIKASKNGPYVEWSGPVTFKVGAVSNDCFITEDIDFKLYLFDSATSTTRTAGAAIRDITFVAPKQTATGKIYSQSSEDGYSINPNSQAAAPLSLHYNEVGKRWEAGSVNILAKLIDNISASKAGPSVDHLSISDNSESLQSPDTSFVPSSGKAMPINAQNGNPLQWQPNYAKAKCASEQISLEKDIVSVYNFNPRRAYSKDEMVTLTKIDDLWHIIPMEPAPDIEEELNKTDGLKWGEFTYFMTNSDHYFRKADQTGNFRFSPKDAETSFHFDYYLNFSDPGNLNNPALNSGVFGKYGELGGYDGNFDTSTISFASRLGINHGYFQTTSFDFLDSKVFGIRGKNPEGDIQQQNDKCSIAHTNANRTSDGKNIVPDPNEYAARNAAHCGVFFGCIFPDGYEGFQQYFNTERNFDVVIGSNSLTENGLGYFSAPLPTSDDTNSTSFVFESVDSRNNCRQATLGSRDSNFGSPDDLQWVRAKEEVSYGIFHDRATLNSMPADIMLNASPSGTNGSPLCPIHRFSALHNNPGNFSNNGILNIVKNAFNDRYWLRKKPSQSSNIPDNNKLYDSAFDFKPIDPNHIMFRPLKLEAYVQFNGNEAGNISAARNLSKSALRGSRFIFQHEAYRTQMDYSQPASPYAYARENGRLEGNFEKIWEVGSGLKWGGQLDQRFKPVYRNLHYGSYWGGTFASLVYGFQEGAMQWSRVGATLPTQSDVYAWDGAGAYGVITTYKTVAAQDKITITTDNRYGMGAQAAGTFSIAGGMSDQRRTWGVSSFDNSYRQENIHDLSVRIYHHHPSEQTLFDPRTFAVHHFNPGINTPTATEVEAIRSSRTQKVRGTRLNYRFWSPVNSVDFQEPSRFVEGDDDNAVYEAESIPLGSIIFSNLTLDGGIQKPRVIDKKFWRFNGARVGKLLPYRYAKTVIGIPVNIDQEIAFGNGMIRSTDINSDTDPTLLIVRSPGVNYQPGDVIGSTQFGVRFQVAEVGPSGDILKLRCLSAGDFGAENTAKFEDSFNPNSIGPIRVRDTISTSAGRQFDGYYIVGRTNIVLEVDKKPMLVQDTTRVAANVPQATHRTSGPNREIEPLAIVEQQKENNFLLNDSNRSSDGRYDVFFHFHNDITMTWLASNQDFHGDRFNASEAVEQFISARINVG